MILNRRLTTTGILLGLCWILFAYRKLGIIRSSSPAENGWDKSESWSGEEFVAAAMSASIEDDFDYSQITTLCAAQSWDKEVVFTCHEIIGGLGNVKQQLLSCIRYAIDAGAGLIVPTINKRSSNDLSDLKNGTTGLDSLFDGPRFLSRMAKACPQMRLYENAGALEKLGPVKMTELVKPSLLPHWPGFPVLSVRKRVEELKAPPGNITIIPFGMTQAYYPICHDPILFADNFGLLLPLRNEVHYLAALVLQALSSRFRIPIDPSNPTTLPDQPTFLGIHLRTAADALPNWPTYGEQATYYLSHIQSSEFLSRIPVIYLASGNQTSVSLFATEAEALPQPIATVTKYDLLRGADLEQLSSLTWDQQALVDYLVLLRSSYFMGMAESSFAWAVAVKRRVTGESGSCGFRKGLYSGYLWNSALWDEFSNIMGPHPFGWEINMWP